jgi:hypothetical protein
LGFRSQPLKANSMSPSTALYEGRQLETDDLRSQEGLQNSTPANIVT